MDTREHLETHHPAWMRAWNQRAAEIDEHIISFVQSAGEQTGGLLDGIGHSLISWWDRQHMDADTRAEFERLRINDALFKSQLDERLQQLIHEGRVKLAQDRRLDAEVD